METIHRLYGRRVGRPLRPGQAARIDRLLPALALPATLPEDPRALFPAPVEAIWLEIGFGGGEHMALQAKANPRVGFIGVEPFINGVAKLLDHVERDGLTNVRLLHGDARPLLSRLPDACLQRLFVLFPDPWRKARHHARRLIQHGTVAEFARLLADGGELRVASDHPDYQTWILERLTANPDIEWTARRPEDWRARPEDWPPTRYEQKALAAGRTPLFFKFVRKDRGVAKDRSCRTVHSPA